MTYAESAEWIDREEWPVESETPSDGEDITCPCGNTIVLHWNGGELDEKLCSCGRFYRTEHRSVALVVRRAPEGEMEKRQHTCRHGASSGGICDMCGKVLR